MKKKPKIPAWSRTNFKKKIRPMRQIECAQCNVTCIPHAYHPTQAGVKFCSFVCGKSYMLKPGNEATLVGLAFLDPKVRREEQGY